MKVVTSPSSNAPKAGNHIHYHEQLDQLKQKVAENEKKTDEWNKSIYYKLILKFVFISFNSS